MGDLYRELTGDEISEGAKLAGSGLFGGPIGLIGGLANTIVESHTGKSIAGNVVGLFEEDGAQQVASASVPTAAAPNTDLRSAPQSEDPPPQSTTSQTDTSQTAAPQPAALHSSAPEASASLARAAATAPDSARIVELSESIATGRQPGTQPNASPQPAQPTTSNTGTERAAFGGFMRLPDRGEPTYRTPPDGPPNVADAATQAPSSRPVPLQPPDNAPVELSGRAADVLLQLAEGSQPTPAAGSQPPDGGGSDPAPRSERANDVRKDAPDSASPATTSAQNTEPAHSASLNETAAAFVNPPENIAKSMLDALKKYEALKTTNG